LVRSEPIKRIYITARGSERYIEVPMYFDVRAEHSATSNNNNYKRNTEENPNRDYVIFKIIKTRVVTCIFGFM